MKNLKNDIKSILKKFEQKIINEEVKDLTKTLLTSEINKYIEKKAVLGIDIYRYSQYPILEQSLIPHLFKEIYLVTVQNCLNLESIFFDGKTEEDFADTFIDTGDGGFQIFDSPLQMVIFSIYFQAGIKRYNTGKFKTQLLFKIIGEITLRYAMTYDNTYSYDKNFYGASIINNARIMSKDKLNRVLIDNFTLNWFDKEMNGIENLQNLTIEELKVIRIFNKLDFTKKSSLIKSGKGRILKVDILRIGEITSKLDILLVHSLHIQVSMTSVGNESFKRLTVTLGNLNSAGLSE
jgi:hypothetical protein